MKIKRLLCGSITMSLMTFGLGTSVTQAALDTAVPKKPLEVEPVQPFDRKPFFGQTHQHTGWSFDANIYNVQLGPENAFKHARGDRVKHPWGYFVKLKEPLDFLMVSDHGEYLGVIKMMNNPNNPIALHPLAEAVRASGSDVDDSTKAFYGLVASAAKGGKVIPDPVLNYEGLRMLNWKRMVHIVDKYNNPGTFTTLAGFEWSSQPYTSNLHRNIVFRDTEHLPDMPFTYFDSGDPQDLWKWMDGERAKGATLLAIPHNGNLSQGLMYPDVVLGSLDGDSLQSIAERAPIDTAYAEARARNEKLTEIIQTKGQSETHPLMSPYDEFSGFELWTKPVAGPGTVDPSSPNNYVREAFKRGMKYRQTLGVNPFKYGVVGGGDIHTSIVSHEEYAHTGEHNLKSATPKQRLLESESGEPSKIEQGSAGLSCVWADRNTRGAIYDAMERKEAWATSGSRIVARIFGGYGYTEDMLHSAHWARHGYAQGVPMGGDLTLPKDGQKPTFMVWAQKGPNSGNLDRIQMVKGWVDAAGNTHERIVNVVWSNHPTQRTKGMINTLDAAGNPDNYYDTLPAIGTDHVNVSEATYDNTMAGSAELKAVWTDEDFDPAVPAFYYLRVLEIPTPRWSTYDAKALNDQYKKMGQSTKVIPPNRFPTTIQERAWTSPIWYTPNAPTTLPAQVVPHKP